MPARNTRRNCFFFRSHAHTCSRRSPTDFQQRQISHQICPALNCIPQFFHLISIFFSLYIYGSFQTLKYPKSVAFIISNEFCERFNYYGMRSEYIINPISVQGRKRENVENVIQIQQCVYNWTEMEGVILRISFNFVFSLSVNVCTFQWYYIHTPRWDKNHFSSSESCFVLFRILNFIVFFCCSHSGVVFDEEVSIQQRWGNRVISRIYRSRVFLSTNWCNRCRQLAG